MPEIRAFLAAPARFSARRTFQNYELRTGKFLPDADAANNAAFPPRSVPVAAIRDVALPEIPPEFSRYDSRNNRLLLAAFAQIRNVVSAAISRFGADRVGVILGTSNSGIEEALCAISHQRTHGELPQGYNYAQQELGSPAQFLAEFLGVRGASYTISTACSSSARAMITAARLVRTGALDAVITGGADALCRLAVNGFLSLGALSPRGCSPFSVGRDGITIGEAAALTVISREPPADAPPIALLGYGESSDAHHASAPHPEGIGAEAAMRAALESAKLTPGDIGYVSLHGTGTPLNDSMEAFAMFRLFGSKVPCSSIKHLAGHTLGTCGAVAAAVAHALLADYADAANTGSARHRTTLSLPMHDFTASPRDPALAPIALVDAAGKGLSVPRILANSFAFGGNNACLCIGLPS